MVSPGCVESLARRQRREYANSWITRNQLLKVSGISITSLTLTDTEQVEMNWQSGIAFQGSNHDV